LSRSFEFRRFVFVLAVAMGFIVLVPAQRASAHDSDLPFEVSFPQQADETTFSNTWGARRSGGRGHRGTDLMAEKMTEVYAFADGVVTKVGSSRRAGRYIIIEHAQAWDTYYIHLNNDNPGSDDGDADWSLTVADGIEVGSRVVAGQLIGWVGDSGNAEGGGSHTHFELRSGDRNINPYHVLEGAYRVELWRLAQVEAQSARDLVIV
jgi:murein DD-endopeptidase MepM/ murein hydrolase activator NlpD